MMRDSEIQSRLGEILEKDDRMTVLEKGALMSNFLMLAEEKRVGTETGWDLKVMGIIQFLRWADMISEEQEEDLCMLSNAITAGAAA